jgi:galactose mutarotase-like enzyme
VRQAEFNVAAEAGDRVVFEYAGNDKTYGSYPFKFLLRIIFEVKGSALVQTYRVENKNDRAMYFSIGSHEGFNCDGTYISESVNSAALITGEQYTVIENGRVIPLKPELFANDAMIFKNVPSPKIFLKSKKSSAVVEMDYEDAPHLGIWTKVGAPFVCIEPWYGLPDFADHDGKIENKYGIITVQAGDAFQWTHTIKVHEPALY